MYPPHEGSKELCTSYVLVLPSLPSLFKYALRFFLSHTLKALGYKDGQVTTSALDLKVNISQPSVNYIVVRAVSLHTGPKMLRKERPTVGVEGVWNQGIEGCVGVCQVDTMSQKGIWGRGNSLAKTWRCDRTWRIWTRGACLMGPGHVFDPKDEPKGRTWASVRSLVAS